MESDIAVWVVIHPPLPEGSVPPEVFVDQEQAEEWARLGNMNPGAQWKVFQVFWKDRQAGQTTIDYNRALLRERGLLTE
jgi:hypothetical protein